MKKLINKITFLSKKVRVSILTGSALVLMLIVLLVMAAFRPEAAENVITNMATVTYQDAAGNSYSVPSNTVTTTISETQNSPPNTPTNIYPANGATNIDPQVPIKLEKSTFSDPNSGQSQSKVQFQVTSTGGNYTSPIWDSSQVSTTNSYVYIPAGRLQFNTRYYWRCKVWDNYTTPAESAWSAETSFTTRLSAQISEGDLVNVTGKPEVYVIIGTKKFHIATYDAFATGYNYDPKNIKAVSQSTLDGFSYGGKLWRQMGCDNACEGGKVFFMSHGKRYWVSMPAYVRLGFRWSEIVMVTQTFITSFPNSDVEVRNIIYGDAPEVWLRLGQYKMHISDAATLSSYAGWDELKKVENSIINGLYPSSTKLYRLAASFAKEDGGKLWLISAQKRYWVRSWGVISRLRLPANISDLPIGFIEAYPYAGDLW